MMIEKNVIYCKVEDYKIGAVTMVKACSRHTWKKVFRITFRNILHF